MAVALLFYLKFCTNLMTIVLLFLFEVYRKQSQIWDTLPTSEMELFVIKRICKVISCRLVILYTQYCLMNFFICVSLQVSFGSRWFHLQKSKILLFVAITIANVVFYWTIVFHAQFLPMNFSFLVSFVAESIFQVVPACSRCFQLVLGSSSTFQVVPSRSSLFLVLVCMQNLEFNECWG